MSIIISAKIDYEFSSPIFGDMFLLAICEYLNLKNVWVFVSYIRRYVLTKMFNPRGLLFSKFRFSSPIFGDMFLLSTLHNYKRGSEPSFSSPIFGDMFLLGHIWLNQLTIFVFSSPIFGDMFLLCPVFSLWIFLFRSVFVSYIRRYVLTKGIKKDFVKGDEMVFVSYIRRYVLTADCIVEKIENHFVFVSYIRRYVLTRFWFNHNERGLPRFRLLYSEICSY